MKEQLRLIGVEMGMTGTALMEEMLEGKITTKELNDKQIEAVLAAWDTRNYVPYHLIDKVDKVQPAITKEEVANGHYRMQEYNRNYVEMIEKYLHSIM